MYNDEEGGMAKAQLLKIENYAKKLNDMIHPDDELEAWVQSKLSVVAAYMGDIKHYLDYELQKFGEGGSVDKDLEMYEIEFTWDKSDDDDFDSRTVKIWANSIEEAQKLAKDKFSPYYKGFKITEVEKEENDEEDMVVEIVVVYKDLEKDGGHKHTERYLVRAEGVEEAKNIATEMWEEAWVLSDLSIFEVLTDEEYRSKYLSRRDNFGKGGKVKKKWIQDALSSGNKGALRKTAKRKKLITGDEPLSMSDLKKLQKMGGKTAKRAYLAETLRSFDRGGGIGDIAIREQGSTFEEDYKEAREWIGEEKWNNMNLDERKEATYMLKAKGYIGYPDWYEDVETISAMQYAKGGGVDRYNLSFNYNPSVFKTEDAKAIVKKYTSDWSHDNDLDEVSFYVQGLSKEKVEELSRELKMEDVYNIEYELSRYKYAKGGGVSQYKKFGEDNIKLRNFDLGKLDRFEEMQYNNFVKTLTKAEALQILINNVEGDYSQLSPSLSKIAEEQYPSEEFETEYARRLFLLRSNINPTSQLAKGGKVGLSKNDIEILGVPRSKISEKEWQSILRMAKYQDGATFILKDEKGLDVVPQTEYEWYIKEKYDSEFDSRIHPRK